MPVASLLLAYLVGSIPFALLLAKRWGTEDLHQVGSGNIGAANVLRAYGVKAGVLVAILDIAKGAVSVMLAQQLTGASPSAGTPAVAGFAAVVGHIYPVWLRFRGGKGVATASGAFAVLAPTALAPAAAIFLAAVWLTRYISIGSTLGSATLPVLAWTRGLPDAVVLASTATAALIVFRHRSNLARVWAGTERRVGARL